MFRRCFFCEVFHFRLVQTTRCLYTTYFGAIIWYSFPVHIFRFVNRYAFSLPVTQAISILRCTHHCFGMFSMLFPRHLRFISYSPQQSPHHQPSPLQHCSTPSSPIHPTLRNHRRSSHGCDSLAGCTT